MRRFRGLEIGECSLPTCRGQWTPGQGLTAPRDHFYATLSSFSRVDRSRLLTANLGVDTLSEMAHGLGHDQIGLTRLIT
jgi:hypothetical protein